MIATRRFSQHFSHNQSCTHSYRFHNREDGTMSTDTHDVTQEDPEQDAHQAWWKAQAIGICAALGLTLAGAVASSMRRLHASRSTPKPSKG